MVEDVANIYAEQFVELRKNRIHDRYLSSTGLKTVDEFFCMQDNLNSEWFLRTSEAISSERLGVEAIIAGLDHSGAHLWTIGTFDGYETTLPRNHDDDAYAAVGTGAREFLTALRMTGYSRAIGGSLNGFQFMFWAKKRAEYAQSVGTFTDASIVVGNEVGWMPQNMLTKLRKCVDDLEDATKKTRQEVMGKMLQDELDAQMRKV